VDEARRDKGKGQVQEGQRKKSVVKKRKPIRQGKELG